MAISDLFGKVLGQKVKKYAQKPPGNCLPIGVHALWQGKRMVNCNTSACNIRAAATRKDECTGTRFRFTRELNLRVLPGFTPHVVVVFAPRVNPP